MDCTDSLSCPSLEGRSWKKCWDLLRRQGGEVETWILSWNLIQYLLTEEEKNPLQRAEKYSTSISNV